MGWEVTLKAMMSSALLAFGITMTAPQFFAGMLLAFFAAAFAILAVPDRSRGEFFFSIGTGLFAAGLVAIHGKPIIPGIENMQVTMGIIGGFARFLFLIIPKLGGRLVDRAEDVADSAIDKIAGEK